MDKSKDEFNGGGTENRNKRKGVQCKRCINFQLQDWQNQQKRSQICCCLVCNNGLLLSPKTCCTYVSYFIIELLNTYCRTPEFSMGRLWLCGTGRLQCRLGAGHRELSAGHWIGTCHTHSFWRMEWDPQRWYIPWNREQLWMNEHFWFQNMKTKQSKFNHFMKYTKVKNINPLVQVRMKRMGLGCVCVCAHVCTRVCRLSVVQGPLLFLWYSMSKL